MTREEAIYVLNELLEKVKASQNKTNILVKEKQALEIAIEALKERLAIDHETMKSDFGEIELRGIEKIGG